jgi:hypothetical protein
LSKVFSTLLFPLTIFWHEFLYYTYHKHYIMKQENQVQAPGISTVSEIFSDEFTKEKIRKHLSDINDVITEDDIKNAKTSMTTVWNAPVQTDTATIFRKEKNKTRITHSPGIDNISLNVLED